MEPEELELLVVLEELELLVVLEELDVVVVVVPPPLPPLPVSDVPSVDPPPVSLPPQALIAAAPSTQTTPNQSVLRIFKLPSAVA